MNNTSIIIPLYAPDDQIVRLNSLFIPCLQSVLKYTSNQHEIIIVANGCGEVCYRSLWTFLSFENVRIIYYSRPIGFTAAINKGIHLTRNDFIVFLNDDCILLEQQKDHWLKLLQEPFRDTRMGATGPYEMHIPNLGSFLVGFCLMTRKDLYPYLDETFNPGGYEDADLCFRLRKRGWKTQQVTKTVGENETHDFMIGGFPLYHKGEATMDFVSGWKAIESKNFNVFKERVAEGYYS